MQRSRTHILAWGGALCVAALLAGCASGPETRTATPSQRDGAPAQAPADLASLPDPVPRIEPIRKGGPNKPYAVLGQSYEPIAEDVPWREQGVASWYGTKFHGRRTASGELFSMYGLTAAHRTLPIPSYARVRHVKTGKSVIVRINDRGPFHASRVIDLSYAAAVKLGMASAGNAQVEVTRLTFDDIRRGVWGSESSSADEAAAGSATAEVAAVPAPAALVSERVSAASVPSSPPPSRAHTPAQRGFYVQLAAMRQREGVDRLQQRVSSELADLLPMLAVFHEASLYKLKVGPYATRQDAVVAAAQAREALQLSPMVVERR
ncbi:MAG: septal ring lytic transglycosylase RlpA family protein [Aquabacterium sp.]|jgi:rare lipoprotein A|uniref:septal ring lytic transglycosylase RlpA family protein n=1 Tax=Aquabacterium sp. TaxID=1872578 RepID=UPI002A358D7A|nr:septal ring lytic transglycosylase RlpA family protein [Aquabacterium sp.]MDX9844446.1 septal ring lytic transglycosylase RlpA family protein [Aquabacterium sp.]